MMFVTALARRHRSERLAPSRLLSRWWARSWADAAGVALLLLAAVALTWPLWRTLSGIVNYIDYNLPVSADAAASAFRHSLSPWSGAYGLGSPNVGFLGTVEFLALFRLISFPFGIEIGSRVVLILLLWMDALGAYLVLRVSYRVGVAAACSGALFFILNPWVYDTVSQGHLYTLEMLAIAPFLVLAVPRLRRISTAAIVAIAIATAVTFGSDYHFGLLILLFLGLEGVALVIRGKARRAVRLTLGIAAGLGLLSVFLYPYLMSISSIRNANSPAFSDLAYFSRFTSWTAAFSLLRPGMNAWAEVGLHGAIFRTLWSLTCISISLVSVAIVLRGGWRRLTGSPALPLLALASIGFANGANGLTMGTVSWVYSHVPLAGVFRDPSKFLLFPLLMYVPAVALLFEGEVAGLLRGDSESGLRSRSDGTGGPIQGAHLPARIKARRTTAWAASGPLSVLVLFAPLLAPGIRTISTVPTNSDSVVPTAYARVAYLPPWQFLLYPGQPVPVNDPVQIYPRVAVAGLAPDYDDSAGNSFLRWLYSALYFRRTDSFFNLARLAGISDVVARSDLEPVAGYSVTQQMFAQEHLISALRTQRATPDDARHVGDQVIWHVSGGSTISGSNALLRVRGSNLGVLNDVADLTDMAGPAICFEPYCPSGNRGLTLGLLNDVPPKSAGDSHLQIATTDAYNRDMGGPWINGRVAYAEGFGAVPEQLVDVAVGIGPSRGPLSIVGDLPKTTLQLWVQLLRGPDPITYTVRCGSARLPLAPLSTLGSYVWTWARVGPVDASMLSSQCTIGMHGGLGAVAGGALTPSFRSRTERSTNTPRILLSPAVAADSWRRAKAASFNYPGVTSTAAIVSGGGNLSFKLPPVASPRHLYVNVVGIHGRVHLRSQQVQSLQITPVILRDQRGWVDLGNLPRGQRDAEISVRGGKVAVTGIALAAPTDMAALKAAGSSEARVGLQGNGGLEGTGDATVSYLRPAGLSTFLIVRSSAGGFWSLNGRRADGTYAGYGQIYRIAGGESGLVRTVLRERVAIGAAMSATVAVGLLLAIAATWLRRRLRRASNPTARIVTSELGHPDSNVRRRSISHESTRRIKYP
jgi:hypothetical protein